MKHGIHLLVKTSKSTQSLCFELPFTGSSLFSADPNIFQSTKVRTESISRYQTHIGCTEATLCYKQSCDWYLVSALGVWVLGKLGFLSHDPFVWETAKKFLPAAIVFYLAIFTNTNLLRHANVDTFIVFRSLTPLLVAIADTTFRKQPIPSKLTFLSLLIILGGAVGYVATDSGFTLTAYSWAFAYLITITTEMVYIKHMVTNLGLNTWGFVYYNNLLSLMMAPFFWIMTGEYSDVFAAVGSNHGNLFEIIAFTAVSLSCVFGLLISFFGFACRKAISATAFTQSVTGVNSPSIQRDPVASKLMDDKDDGDYSNEDEEKGISGKISGV
ncbi:unnamed protein product [Lactuca virosa]|uniref:Sugar phosphate transporter domain-containing protein n=1 Tax=Lactuca virosa TaxID=75947 RepID=A0AAU9MQE2_9ASTR|nr:unnamed protein product [Lactuca virosa]